MREAQYTSAIHKKLPTELYRWKISDRFTSGVPDAYYSGSKGDLWVEYKYVKKLPVRRLTPALSALQKSWLNARHEQGRKVAVIVGSPQGSVILTDGCWNSHTSAPFTTHTHAEVAEWITAQTMPVPQSSSKPPRHKSASISP